MRNDLEYIQQLRKITKDSLKAAKEKELEAYKETLEKMKPSIEDAAKQGLSSTTFNAEEEMFSGITFDTVKSFLEHSGFYVERVDAISGIVFQVSWGDRLTIRGGLYPAPEDIRFKG